MTNTTPQRNPDRDPKRDQKTSKKATRVRGFRARVLAACCGLVLLAGAPGAVYAQSANEDLSDARLQGYSARPAIEKSGVGPTWLLFIFLSVVGCSVLFKNAKRSHLD